MEALKETNGLCYEGFLTGAVTVMNQQRPTFKWLKRKAVGFPTGKHSEGYY